MKTIEIDLTEEDCYYLLKYIVHKEGREEWVYRTIDKEGEDIRVVFKPYEEE